MPTSPAKIHPDMANKKKATSDEQPKPGRGRPEKPPTTTVSARLPADLVDAVDRFIGATKPEPTMKSVLQDALEKYLAEKGFWPPRGSGANTQEE